MYKYKLTKVIADYFDKNKCKSNLVDRVTKNFTTLKDLAIWSRANHFYTHNQKRGDLTPKTIVECEKLSKPGHILWLDLDYDVDVKDLKSKLTKAK